MSTSIDRELWRACAGRTVRASKPDSDVYYSPQGHAENANCSGEIAAELGISPLVHCCVLTAELEADSETGDFFERIRLLPLPPNSGEKFDGDGSPETEFASHAKILTQSDANNGGGFSVPRRCAETIFLALDYSANPPVQELFAHDLHGEIWKFRHIYRGTPLRHLLTSGWSAFVNRKRLVAGDSIVFLRGSGGEIGVGIRRARRSGGAGSVRAPEFEKAVKGLARGEAFEVRYYPRNGAEFCVRASAMRKVWSGGTRVKMEVENELGSGVRSCSGIVVSPQAYDPVRWPASPWKMLKVKWDDEADRLRIPQCVSPWMIEHVEDVPNFPSFQFPPYLSPPPRKKMRLTVSIPVRSNAPFGVFTNNTPASIQGARHSLTDSSTPDLTLSNKLTNNSTASDGLELGNYTPSSVNSEMKTIMFLFHGKSIDVENQGSSEGSNGYLIRERENSVTSGRTVQPPESSRARIPCNAFVGSNDLGFNIDLVGVDLAGFGSYDRLYSCLSDTLKIEKSVVMSRVLYEDGSGAVKPTGTVPFSDFVFSAKSLKVLALPNTLSVGSGPVPGSEQ